MSQILADEHLGHSEVVTPLQSWITVQKIEELASDTILKDDRVLQIPRAQKQSTFITLFKTKTAPPLKGIPGPRFFL